MKKHNTRRIVSILIVLCLTMALIPMSVFADSENGGGSLIIVNGGAPVNIRTLDNSVDNSSICVRLNAIVHNTETGEDTPYTDFTPITPESVTVDTFNTVKANAIEDAKTALNNWLELMRRENPDIQFTVVGDMVVEGNDASFDNRTYVMRSDGGSTPIIIGDGEPDSETTTSRYMEINGDYGKTGDYSVTMTVNVQTAETPDYKIVEGANGAWTQNSDKTLIFRANGDFSKFTGVKIDGTLIDAKNYTAVSGSTVITLKADYLKTLSVGTHKLTVVYANGECNTNFEVKAKLANTNNSEKSPQTGDNSHMALWIFLLFVSGAGVIGTTVYGKKKKMKAE